MTLSVRPEDRKHLFTRQYNIPQALHNDVEAIVARWLKEGRVKLAPVGCQFNSPLLPVKKKDDATGKMTKVRLCVDIRKLNSYLLEDDKFQLPRKPDMLATLAGGKLFGEFDLSEAYFSSLTSFVICRSCTATSTTSASRPHRGRNTRNTLLQSLSDSTA